MNSPASWTALAAAALLSACANSPPHIAPALMAKGQGVGVAGTFSVNLLGNYGKTGYRDTVRVERGDGKMVEPTYENHDLFSPGRIWMTEHAFFAWYLPNFQAQVYAGLRWRRHAALGYFPTFTFSGRKMLHGVQLDLNGFDRLFLSASLYQENYPSILPNPGLAEAGPVKTYAIGSLFLNIPWRVGKATVWVLPNYRRALDYPSLSRYGVNIAFSYAAYLEKKPAEPDIVLPKEPD